jgi:hypothetical protein
VGSPLQSPRLRGIIVAYTVNRLGTWIGYVALSVAVFDKTHSAVAVAALLVSAQVLPALAVPAVVARVESSPRQAELSGLYFFEGVTTVALAVLLSHFWLPAILLLVALDGTAALAANALLRAALAHAAREWAGESDVDGDAEPQGDRDVTAHAAERKANATLNVGFSLTFMLGPAIGGLVVAASGAPLALVIDAVSFLACGLLLINLRPHVAEAGGASVRARLRAALQHINDVPGLRGLLGVEAIGVVFFASGAPIEVAYAKATLHTGDWGYGVLLAVWGMGSVIGSLIFARGPGKSLRGMLAIGALAVGLAYVGFAAAPSLAFAFVAALLGGCGNGVQWASLISAVQRLTPQSLQGRLMGAVESLGALCPAIGLTLGGALVALSSPRGAFVVVGLGAIATTGGFFILFRRGLSIDAEDGERFGQAVTYAGARQASRPVQRRSTILRPRRHQKPRL